VAAGFIVSEAGHMKIAQRFSAGFVGKRYDESRSGRLTFNMMIQPSVSRTSSVYGL
jgi:hypothetical protein